tara:strand:- start:230 stop:463 length:234 start_codon:yes stop_codon:yes gene_type:complete
MKNFQPVISIGYIEPTNKNNKSRQLIVLLDESFEKLNARQKEVYKLILRNVVDLHQNAVKENDNQDFLPGANESPLD